jgi:hypothetical protein
VGVCIEAPSRVGLALGEFYAREVESMRSDFEELVSFRNCWFRLFSACRDRLKTAKSSRWTD